MGSLLGVQFVVICMTQPIPHLHHDGEHQATDVVTPLGVLRRLELAVVVDLRVEIGHRDPHRRTLDERAGGVGLAADHQGGEALLGVAGIEVGLGELGRLQGGLAGLTPADLVDRVGRLRLASGGLVAGGLDLDADLLQAGDGAGVEGGRGGAPAVEADLGHPVVGGGHVAHRRPEDAPAAVARADDRDVERLARLVVPGDPVGERLARLTVGLVDHVERGGQQVGVGGDLRGEPLAGLGHVGVQGLPHLGGVEFPVAPGQLLERRGIHETLYSRCGEDALLAQGLRERPLDLLIVPGGDGIGGPEPLDQPERADQRPHVVTGQAAGCGAPATGAGSDPARNSLSADHPRDAS